MHHLLLASVPLVLQPTVAPAVSSAVTVQPSVVEISQADPGDDSAQIQVVPVADPLPKSYPYASIQAGVGFPGSLSGKFTLVDFPQVPQVKNSLNLNTGFNGELAVGYKFPDFRTDLSVGYSNFGSQTQTLVFTNVNSDTRELSTPGKGSVELFTVMANAYYDFKIKQRDGSLSRWSPYVGAGIGWGNLSVPGCAITNCATFTGGSANTFVYQGKVGVSYRATDSGFVFLEGGYLGTTATSVSNVSYDPFGAWRLNLGWRQRF